MPQPTKPEPAPSRAFRLAALFLLSASTLLFEVLLTKLFANKLEHHYTFAVIGLALLGYGGSGVLVQMRRATLLPDGVASGRCLWRYSLGWALLVIGVLPVFLILPLDPAVPGAAGVLALPVYFFLFALPFFVAGVPVAAMLMSSDVQPSRVYFWDLSGAAVGALLGPVLLARFGAYVAVFLAASLGFAGALTFLFAGGRRWKLAAAATAGFAAVSALSLAVPVELRARFGFDMVSFKAIVVKHDFAAFGRPVRTYWNAIARLDVSPTAQAGNVSYCYGMPRQMWNTPLPGRLILVDGGANTRQVALERHPRESPFLRSALWAAPYVVRPGSRRALVIGAGGGVDVLIAKSFGVAEIDALELNPDMIKLLEGRSDDAERGLYTPWLRSDEWTQVRLHNVEARHFAHRSRGQARYDVVLASGVDTLTAIQSSGNALSENFLYTADAVRDYMDVLEPGGILALTHWHLEPPRHALKMFATYLQVLEQAGVQNPGAHVAVVSDGLGEKFAWETTLMKKGEPFTPAEIEALRSYAAESGFQITWEPYLPEDAPLSRPGDAWFRQLGRADTRGRERILSSLPFDVSPATDDRPYFYWVNQRSAGSAQYDGNWIYAEVLYPQASMRWMMRTALMLCVAMAAAPALVMMRRRRSLRAILGPLPFFAFSGVAFVLAENAVFLMVTLFVGGPLYSLSLVLPSILAGYAVGSLLSSRLPLGGRSSPFLLAALCIAAFAFLGLVAFTAMPALITLGQTARMVVAVAAILPFAMALGCFAPWYMARMKLASSDPALAWMWSLSAIGNVVGSMLFVPACHAVGTRAIFGASAVLYLLALAWTAAFDRTAAPQQLTPDSARTTEARS